MRHTKHRLTFAFTSFLLPLTVGLTAPAMAQTDADKAMARQLATEAQEALDKGDGKTAEERFGRADRLFHAPTILLGMARAQKAQKKYFSAQATYLRIINEGAGANPPAAFLRAVEDAKKEVDEVSTKVGNLVVNVNRNGAEKIDITLDGEKYSSEALGLRRPINPGEHTIRVTAEGYREKTEKVKVDEGGSKSVELVLEKDPNALAATTTPKDPTPLSGKTPDPVKPMESPVAPASSGGVNHTGSFIAWGIGGAGLIMGLTTGLVAMGKKSDLEKLCTLGADKCPASAESNISSYHTMATLSTVGFIVAGVGGAAGAVLWFMAPKEDATKASVSPYVSPSSIGLTGRF